MFFLFPYVFDLFPLAHVRGLLLSRDNPFLHFFDVVFGERGFSAVGGDTFPDGLYEDDPLLDGELYYFR